MGSISNGTKSEDADVADKVKEAERYKDEANRAFKEKHFQQAEAGYTKAIELNPNNCIYYANRSFAHLRLENFGSAVADATKSIDLDSKYVKGYYRRGEANFAAGKFKEAVRDLRTAARMEPKDATVRKKLVECEKEVKRIRFEEALAVPDEKAVPIEQTVDLASMVVEESYTGPRMEGNGQEGYRITEGFIRDMMEEFRKQKTIHRRFAFEIIMAARDIIKELPSLVDVTIPDEASFTVCGDVHGQYYDLLHIFDLNGLPSEDNPYLFNGDFVDRGSFSVEVILVLMAWKVLLPRHMHLARGNHESAGMNKIYGFHGEVKAKYTAQMAELFRDTFCWLPLAHCLNARVLVVHGGLFSQDGVKLDAIRSIDRYREPPEEGLMCELLWSDPQPPEGRAPSKRGVGVAFGPDVTARFLAENNLELIVRSHEVKDNGYEIEHNGNLITVFSAPNYCDQMGNKGAFIRFKGSEMIPRFTTYAAVPHPNVRPMAYATGFMGGMFGF